MFSEIERAVLDGDFDAGLIIHEGRFTYQQKGLTKLIDLGDWWEQTTHAANPARGHLFCGAGSTKSFQQW